MQALTTDSRFTLRLIVAILLIGSFLVMAGAELLEAQLEADCEDHCEDSCQSCGDCTHCLPTLHMIAGSDSVLELLNDQSSWYVGFHAENHDGNPADGIDHPPQNLS